MNRVGGDGMLRWACCLALVFCLFFCYKGASCAFESKGTRGDRGSRGIISIADEKNGDPQTDEFNKLKEELERLIKEIKRLEKDLRDKISKELLPRIRKEIEKLRERLRDFQRKEGDDSEPKKT
ncbi:MAG: hypothetical protein ABIG67_09615 [Pseudomonadota bacterium]